MIIDCHCHAGPGDGLTGPWDSNAALGRYARRAREAGIDRTVLLAAFHSDYGAANAGVARLVASQPERYLAFAFVHARRDAGRIAAMVRKAVEEYEKIGRADEVAKLKAEIAVVDEYLPKKASVEETERLVDAFLSGKTYGEKQVGQAMGAFMKEHGGRVDSGQVNALLRKRLAGK